MKLYKFAISAIFAVVSVASVGAIAADSSSEEAGGALRGGYACRSVCTTKPQPDGGVPDTPSPGGPSIPG